jgi:hypothetical protein
MPLTISTDRQGLFLPDHLNESDLKPMSGGAGSWQASAGLNGRSSAVERCLVCYLAWVVLH